MTAFLRAASSKERGHKRRITMADQYQALRGLRFPTVMQGLGLSLEHFKTRKGDTEWYGPCPVHRPKTTRAVSATTLTAALLRLSGQGPRQS